MVKSITITALLVCLQTAVAAEPSTSRQAELRHLLEQDCGSCHGMTLKGGLGPALTAEALKGKTKDTLVVTILEGRPGTPMPPWSGLLTKEEASWLVEHMYKRVAP